MKKFLLLFCLLSVFFCRTAMADFYKWVDEKGETQITDYPPPLDKAAKDVEIHKSSAEDITNPQEDVQKSQKKKEVVVIYTKNDCKDCDKAREFLKSKNIPFTVNQKLRKVPLDGGAQRALLFLLEELIQIAGVLSVYVDLGKARKRRAIVQRSETLNLFDGAGCLVSKLVAGKVENFESLFLVFVV